MAEMALEDKIQAAVDRQVAAVLVGHAQELQNVQEQLQQTLDRRTQVCLLTDAVWEHMCCCSSRHAQASPVNLCTVICSL